MRHLAAKLPKFSVLSINVGNAHLLITILFLALCFTPKVNFAQSKSDKQVLKTIVIDAGHGGKDPGCHGSFAHEKHVCLAIAMRLGELIKAKYPNINIVYTRNTDVFVELIERANIANRAKADLFICIHANAGSNVAYGTETYVLGLHRTEAQQRVAERENSIIALEDDKGAKYEDFDMSPDAIIAKQLQLSVFLDHSILFATNLQKEFKRIGRYDRGVKQAGFLVLYKTTMPSVLIETGFLTNPTEENFLGKNEGQEKMANSMFKAFENYKNQLEGKAVISENPSPNLVSNENPREEEKPAIT
ncbi:MAG: N-acetylmuramoyl-L-alanine amidase, partial [Bacteroidota bacterium]